MAIFHISPAAPAKLDYARICWRAEESAQNGDQRGLARCLAAARKADARFSRLRYIPMEAAGNARSRRHGPRRFSSSTLARSLYGHAAVEMPPPPPARRRASFSDIERWKKARILGKRAIRRRYFLHRPGQGEADEAAILHGSTSRKTAFRFAPCAS